MAGKDRIIVGRTGSSRRSGPINGKRVAFRGKSCREVDRKILEYQEQKERGRDFPKIADEWEVQHEGDIGESTRRVYSYAVKRLKEAFPGPAKEIRPLDIQRYISTFEKQGRSANSVSIELCVCKMIFAHAVTPEILIFPRLRRSRRAGGCR